MAQAMLGFPDSEFGKYENSFINGMEMVVFSFLKANGGRRGTLQLSDVAVIVTGHMPVGNSTQVSFYSLVNGGSISATQVSNAWSYAVATMGPALEKMFPFMVASVSTSTEASQGSSNGSDGSIAGIVIGVVGGVAITLVVVVLLVRRRNRRRTVHTIQLDPNQPGDVSEVKMLTEEIRAMRKMAANSELFGFGGSRYEPATYEDYGDDEYDEDPLNLSAAVEIHDYWSRSGSDSPGEVRSDVLPAYDDPFVPISPKLRGEWMYERSKADFSNARRIDVTTYSKVEANVTAESFDVDSSHIIAPALSTPVTRSRVSRTAVHPSLPFITPSIDGSPYDIRRARTAWSESAADDIAAIHRINVQSVDELAEEQYENDVFAEETESTATDSRARPSHRHISRAAVQPVNDEDRTHTRQTSAWPESLQLAGAPVTINVRSEIHDMRAPASRSENGAAQEQAGKPSALASSRINQVVPGLELQLSSDTDAPVTPIKSAWNDGSNSSDQPSLSPSSVTATVATPTERKKRSKADDSPSTNQPHPFAVPASPSKEPATKQARSAWHMETPQGKAVGTVKCISVHPGATSTPKADAAFSSPADVEFNRNYERAIQVAEEMIDMRRQNTHPNFVHSEAALRRSQLNSVPKPRDYHHIDRPAPNVFSSPSGVRGEAHLSRKTMRQKHMRSTQGRSAPSSVSVMPPPAVPPVVKSIGPGGRMTSGFEFF